MIFDLHQRQAAMVSGCLSLQQRAAKKTDGRSNRRIEFLK